MLAWGVVVQRKDRPPDIDDARNVVGAIRGDYVDSDASTEAPAKSKDEGSISI